MKITQGGKDGADLIAADLPVASTSAIDAPAAAAPLRRGFFDAKPTKPRTKAKSLKASGPDITYVKGRHEDVGSGPNIPDFLRIPPDEQQQRYQVGLPGPGGWAAARQLRNNCPSGGRPVCWHDL